MGKQTSKNIKVGIIVLVGSAFLFAALYLVGSNQNLFGSNFNISARFKNVNGLMVGNNVRFAGIDIGTVKTLTIVNDSTVDVSLLIEEDARKYLRKNAIASIGTDGLMGNKLVNIENGSTKSALIEDGDRIQSASSSEIDALITNLSTTSGDLSEVMKQIKTIISDSAMNRIPVAIEDISATAVNLRKITVKLDGSDALWSTLSNKQLAENLTLAVADIRKTGQQASILVTDLSEVVKNIESGKGTVGMLLSDSISAQKIKMAISNIQQLSDSLIEVSGDLKQITRKINNSEGAVGTILTDTLFAGQLKETMLHLKNSSISLEQNLEALKSNFLFRRYFKKQEKEAKNIKE